MDIRKVRRNFKTLKEEWNEYELDNGVIIRVRIIVKQIREKLDTPNPSTGINDYEVDMQPVIDITKANDEVFLNST